MILKNVAKNIMFTSLCDLENIFLCENIFCDNKAVLQIYSIPEWG